MLVLLRGVIPACLGVGRVKAFMIAFVVTSSVTYPIRWEFSYLIHSTYFKQFKMYSFAELYQDVKVSMRAKSKIEHTFGIIFIKAWEPRRENI